MGYFANGSEGQDYEARYCDHCVHRDDPCVIWSLHLLHNYDLCNKPNSMLHVLIPRSKDGLGNEQCTLFKRGRGSAGRMSLELLTRAVNLLDEEAPYGSENFIAEARIYLQAQEQSSSCG